jgi:hypothetical protein
MRRELKMNDFIKNLCTPPEKYAAGQIWRCAELNEDLLITDCSYAEVSGSVRCSVVSALTDITDGSDIRLDSSVYQFYSRDRVVLRITDGPISTGRLDFFRGKVNEDDLEKILISLKNRSLSKYNAVQKSGIMRLVDRLAPFRFEAVREFEKILPEQMISEDASAGRKPFIVTILRKGSSGETPIYENRLAADSPDLAVHQREFWDKEFDAENKTVIYDEGSTYIRLTEIDGHLYFAADSADYKKVSHIKLIGHDTEVNAPDQEMSFGESHRAFTSFDKSALKEGNWVLSFKLDGRAYKFEVTLG